MNRQWMIVLFAACAAAAAHAEDLQTVYQHALTADPSMQQAEAVHLAVRENKTQAILNMLPLNANANKSWYNQPGVTGSGTSSATTPWLGTLGLQVNLFSWDNWVALKAANSTVAQGEANYEAARQALIARVAQQYFAVLSAQDNLAAQASALQSAERQLEQAERRYEVGLIAVTDVQIARATRDSNAAAVIAAKRTLASANEQLRATTGESYRRLAQPGENMPLLAPDPASEDSWVSTALGQNAALIASRLSVDIAHDDYLTAIGGHLPTITASAQRNWNLSGGNGQNTQSISGGPGAGTIPVLIDTQDIIWSVGVTVPLFSAGATQSKVRQSKYSWRASQAGYEAARRSAEQQARDAYQGVISQIAQVGALKQAVASNQISLQATEAGYEVGTKTAIDVITQRQLLVQAQTNYTQAKYGYLNDIVALRQAAGNLDAATVIQINSWLVQAVETQDTAPTPSPAPAPAAPADAAPAGSPPATTGRSPGAG